VRDCTPFNTWLLRCIVFFMCSFFFRYRISGIVKLTWYRRLPHHYRFISILVEKFLRNLHLLRSERIWDFNIEKNLKELSFGNENWTNASCRVTNLYIRDLVRPSSNTGLLDKCVFIEKFLSSIYLIPLPICFCVKYVFLH
jgi:hypothetical protein